MQGRRLRPRSLVLIVYPISAQKSLLSCEKCVNYRTKIFRFVFTQKFLPQETPQMDTAPPAGFGCYLCVLNITELASLAGVGDFLATINQSCFKCMFSVFPLIIESFRNFILNFERHRVSCFYNRGCISIIPNFVSNFILHIVRCSIYRVKFCFDSKISQRNVFVIGVLNRNGQRNKPSIRNFVFIGPPHARIINFLNFNATQRGRSGGRRRGRLGIRRGRPTATAGGEGAHGSCRNCNRTGGFKETATR